MDQYCNNCLEKKENCTCLLKCVQRQSQAGELENHDQTVASVEQQKEQAAVNISKVVNKDNAKQKYWFERGKYARKQGWGRYSPFYENATADYFFFCGYDSKDSGGTFEQVQALLKEKIEQELKNNPLVQQGLGNVSPDVLN